MSAFDHVSIQNTMNENILFKSVFIKITYQVL